MPAACALQHRQQRGQREQAALSSASGWPPRKRCSGGRTRHRRRRSRRRRAGCEGQPPWRWRRLPARSSVIDEGHVADVAESRTSGSRSPRPRSRAGMPCRAGQRPARTRATSCRRRSSAASSPAAARGRPHCHRPVSGGTISEEADGSAAVEYRRQHQRRFRAGWLPSCASEQPPVEVGGASYRWPRSAARVEHRFAAREVVHREQQSRPQPPAMMTMASSRCASSAAASQCVHEVAGGVDGWFIALR